MTQQKFTTGLDFEALRHAAERGVAQALAGLYAEEAEVRIVNRNSPPNSPFVLHGREAVAQYLKDCYGNGAKHRVEN